nr:Uncharacterized protein A9P81_1271 [Leptospira interrogans serovar Copenhageni/Icterohaemorrhagiae]
MITRFFPFLCVLALLSFNLLFADTVTNSKTNEVIENVKTSENEQGIIVEYQDGTRRGFKKEAVTIQKKEVNLGKRRRIERGNQIRSLSCFRIDGLTFNLILYTSIENHVVLHFFSTKKLLFKFDESYANYISL